MCYSGIQQQYVQQYGGRGNKEIRVDSTRRFQSWVSTTQSVVLTADVFVTIQFHLKTKYPWVCPQARKHPPTYQPTHPPTEPPTHEPTHPRCATAVYSSSTYSSAAKRCVGLMVCYPREPPNHARKALFRFPIFFSRFWFFGAFYLGFSVDRLSRSVLRVFRFWLLFWGSIFLLFGDSSEKNILVLVWKKLSWN